MVAEKDKEDCKKFAIEKKRTKPGYRKRKERKRSE